MPKPDKGEEKSHYISRCVKQVMGEGKEQDAALGQCYGMWRQHHKETNKSFWEILNKMRGPPRLAEAVGTRAMDEEGIPAVYPANATTFEAEDERDDDLEGPDEEDAEDLVDEAMELRAKTFAQVLKQPTVQGVHVASADGKKKKPVAEEAIEKPDDAQKRWLRPMTILKIDPDQRLIFGWASVVESGGKVIVDKQGDIIPPEELEKAAYEYVLASRDGGDMHARRGVSKLVASVVLTPDIKRAMGIVKMEPDHVGWFVGFKVHDDDLWAAVKRGERPEFSIGGASLAAEVESLETYLAHSDVFKARGRRHARPPFQW